MNKKKIARTLPGNCVSSTELVIATIVFRNNVVCWLVHLTAGILVLGTGNSGPDTAALAMMGDGDLPLIL